MPELPEVEGMRRRLAQLAVGRTIAGVEDVSGSATRSFAGIPFAEGVLERHIVEIGRRAKNLLLALDSGDTLLMHFMREGMLHRVPSDTERAKHTQAVLRLDDGYDLRLRDTMRTARWTLCKGRDFSPVSSMRNLGPEYTDPGFTPDYLTRALSRPKALKALLVDQKIVSGVGNGWAHEIAFEARLRPDRRGDSLSSRELERLHRAIITVLERGIVARASSASDVMGDEGWEVAGIHRRKDQPCPICGRRIIAEKLGGNLIYYCPECQK